MKTITRNDLWNALQNKEEITLIEALSQEEFDKAHIPGAIQLTKDDVETKAPTALKNKDARIVVYCANLACDASPAVVGKLDALGYKNVSDYQEGKADWIAAGHPVEATKAVRI